MMPGMQQNRSEQARIMQLVSAYSPLEPPRAPLQFGDYLSLLWRIDASYTLPNRARYYRRCAEAVARGLEIHDSALVKMVEMSVEGGIYKALPNLAYRSGSRQLDAPDRRAAIAQLTAVRSDVMRIGTYQENWTSSWPGSGILDTELRERLFAVLVTALQGQFGSFARLLLVIDMVLSDLLLGFECKAEVSMHNLITYFGYPDPNSPRVQKEYQGD